VALACLGLYLVFLVYRTLYFNSKRFLQIKESIEAYAKECNELNEHIESLKKAYINLHHTDYGSALYTDNSVFRFKRPELKKISYRPNVYECSLSVCKNAQQQPFKYVCKYFNINATEETLEQFEKVFNDFSAAEQGKNLLKNKKVEIINGLKKQIPFLIRKFSYKILSRKLGFNDIDFSTMYFPKYTFSYVSAGGNSSISCDVVFDIDNLERFISYLSEIIKFKKSVAGQRALMTSNLREKIKKRDKYTCQNCGISTYDEPHLLLEIDHIVPLAKNGLTTEENLQTSCWKCNRSKGTK
jgi:rubrerythrin